MTGLRDFNKELLNLIKIRHLIVTKIKAISSSNNLNLNFEELFSDKNSEWSKDTKESTG